MNPTHANARLPAAHASMAGCVATLLEHTPPEFDVTADPVAAAREQLAPYGVGLAEVAEPATFSWPGPFIGRPAGDEDTFVILFGEPPAVLWDPLGRLADQTVELAAAYVLASFELQVPRLGTAQELRGGVEAIFVAAAARLPMKQVDRADAVAGRGLRGDRHFDGAGTFSTPSGVGNALTLIAAEALEASGIDGVDTRRNVVTRGIDLDQLIGRQFTIGGVRCFGRERCEPCAHLQRLGDPGILRALVHRGGLRADVLADGTVRRGDHVAST